MKKEFISLILAGLIPGFISPASAETILGASVGKTFSQTLETEEQQDIEIHDDTHFSISIETTLPNARFGLFYSNMSSHLQNQKDKELEFNYLVFQSALEIPLKQNWSGYLGAHLGINNIEPSWSESDTYLAVGLYGGFEYHLNNTTRVSFETRWLGTVINSNTEIRCDLNASENDLCLWHFDGELLNQFQTSIGLSYRF